MSASAADERAPQRLPAQAHRCVACRALDDAERPRSPRPANYGTTANPLCKTHDAQKATAQKLRRRQARAARVYGVAPTEQDDLMTFQGGTCGCGRRSAVRGLVMDHDHACCDSSVGCGECTTGYLCWQCNQDIIGRLEQMFRRQVDLAGADPGLARVQVARALLRLASHVIDGPLARMRRGEAEPYLCGDELELRIDALIFTMTDPTVA